ncbi:32733_t:CDS:2 [Gigaspora margarita]|uniref:32733_t:CDS:1 n=1 Tax=Gigaspora margarita TaxID=4874 RepID=A0ABN7VRC2_GIGMA|nr:32733_t:CDS:2 [Gigaspora margarita]
MFFSETLLQEPSEDQPEEISWADPTSLSRYKPRRQQKPPRKQQRTTSQDFDDLVFGYEAKTFRDDEMAKKVNAGELLIPWRGESENKILLDRYDVRNLLDDRDRFRKIPYTMTRNTEEIEQEKLCDIERWIDLDSEAEDIFDMSEEERDDYIEEKRKRKRMQSENKEYDYNYFQEFKVNEEEEDTKGIKSNYVPKYSVPQGIATPSDDRVDEIIERTAKFLNSSTDSQMEIVIQAKQANNPKFSFLNKDDPLYPYYKHVRLLLQTGLFSYEDSDKEDNNASGNRPYKNIGKNIVKQYRGDNLKSRRDSHNNDHLKSTDSKGAIGELNSSGVNAEDSNTVKSSKPQSQPIGPVIVPPPDLKIIIDKMATYVSKSGESLEAKVREKHIDDPRFSFLLPWNEFHSYYRQRIQHEKAAETTSDLAEK